MKRFFAMMICLLTALLLALTLAACSDPTTGGKDPATDAPATDVPTAEPTEEPTAEPTEEPTAAPTEEPTAAPTAAPEKFDGKLIDFEEFTDGDLIDDAGTPGNWEFSRGSGTSIYVKENDTTTALIKYDGLYYDGFASEGTPFKFSLDFKNEGLASQFGGFLMNWSDEGEYDRDFSQNNGMHNDGAHTLVGHSGIGFSFNNDNPLYIYVFTYDDEKGLGYKEAEFTLESAVRTNWCKVLFEDNGTDTMTLTIDGKLVATITYGDAGTLKDVPEYEEAYYRTVKVANAAGEEVISVDNALVSVKKSAAIGGRNHWLHVDNLLLQ